MIAWWQGLPDLWQGALIILACIIGGFLIGILAANIVIGIKRARHFAEREEAKWQSRPPDRVSYSPFKLPQEHVVTENKPALTITKDAPKAIAVTKPLESNLLESKTPNLLAEIKDNLAMAAKPATSDLIPFQTKIWDSQNSEIDSLPKAVQEELKQAYVDMRLANNIVWLATEVGRRSPALNDGYVRLCIQIAARLDKIMPTLIVK